MLRETSTEQKPGLSTLLINSLNRQNPLQMPRPHHKAIKKDELTGNMGIDQPKDENSNIVTPLHNGSEVGNRNSLSSKKRKT